VSGAGRYGRTLLVLVDVTALILLTRGGSSWTDALLALFLVAVFTPVKGITYRRLGARLPFATALVATASWQLVGLPIDLDTFSAIMTASFVASLAVDFVALVAMESAPTLARCAFLALYGSAIVHLFTLGFFLFPRSPGIGAPIFVLGAAMFLVPAFYADRFAE